MASRIGSGKPLSNVDVAWLRMESRTNLMTIIGLMCFEERLEFKRLKSLIEDRLLCYDRFRQRVVESKLPFSRPRWVDDEHFNLRAHLLRVALPAPGGKAELEEMVSDLMSTPLDLTKPLWQFQLIETYEGGSALVARIHHCIADGIALVRVLLDMTDDSAGPTPMRRQSPHRESWLPDPLDSVVGSAMKVSESVSQEVARALKDPAHAVEIAREGASAAAVLGKLLTMPADPETVFRGTLRTAKRCAWSEVLPLEDVKRFSKAIGATINDVLLTAVCGALRRYILGRGGMPDGLDLRAVVPVNLRPEGTWQQLGNRFGLVYLSLPVGIGSWPARLAEVKRRMDEIKGSTEAVVSFAVLNALGMAPHEVETLAVEMLGAKATAVMTNVPGPREPVYLAGVPIRTFMFWVPQSGHLGLGVSILSYAGQVRLGIATDAGLVSDPNTIITEFQNEMASAMGSVASRTE